MPSPISIGTREVPLRLAKSISSKVNESWESGEIMSKVSLVTQDLLKFWFIEPHTQTRDINFHIGQKQAILNTIYLHEIIGIKNVKDIYENINFELLAEIDAVELKKTKYEIPKYGIKMATGTGKTWVMHALLIWQYLNAKYETEKSGKFTKNFLLVTPGLIVYERLLDAYLGKEDQDRERHFEESDFFKFKNLFIPENYRDEVFGFIQNSVAKKQEIGTKTTGDGIIAIANWHLFLDREEKEEEKQELENSALNRPDLIAKNILPVKPGISGGNSLDALDSAYLSGKEIDYLSKIDNLMVVNDEAHHIHENKSYGEVNEVEWQKSLNKIAENKGSKFIQIDFSATPYDVSGSGQNRIKHYFPHTVVDFDLKTAIRSGLVKAIAIDKRKELTENNINFSALKENKKVVALSEGQILMIRAGLKRLKILEENFIKIAKDKQGNINKYPKMLIMCENTDVSPLVIDFLKLEGFSDEEMMRVDSNKKGEIPEVEWLQLKQKLFNIDKNQNPKVIVSVLMLREGFDVNNICVIVPLRASSAPILLEQTIGRGLRLMWREPGFEEMRKENINKLLCEKKEPANYIDILSIVEHPAFLQFYEDLDKDLIMEIDSDPTNSTDILGDIIRVGLKENYKEYDLFWPVIVRDTEEHLTSNNFDINKLESFKAFRLEDLKKIFSISGEQFIAEEIMVKTRFGEYIVDANLFTSESYNEYLGRILDVVISRSARVGKRANQIFPVMQINSIEIIGVIDAYIRNKLFDMPFDPFIDNNWKVLLLKNGILTQHIIKEISKVIYEMHNNINIQEAQVDKKYFSSIPELIMRSNYSINITKTIYEKLPFPSNKGGFEKALMEYADNDSKVEIIIKISESYHSFARIFYIRNDGLLASYTPDFIIKTNDKIYIIETKADKDLHDLNVRHKQLAILDWVKRINKLELNNRMNKDWEYVILGETHFYTLKDNHATIDEICNLSKISESNIKGKLL